MQQGVAFPTGEGSRGLSLSSDLLQMLDAMYMDLYATQHVERTNPVAEPMDAATKAAFIDSTPAKEQVKYVLPWGCDLS